VRRLRKLIEYFAATTAKQMGINIGKYTAKQKDLKSEENPKQKDHHSADHAIGQKMTADRNDAIAHQLPTGGFPDFIDRTSEDAKYCTCRPQQHAKPDDASPDAILTQCNHRISNQAVNFWRQKPLYGVLNLLKRFRAWCN
jgi:hypothetical protein